MFYTVKVNGEVRGGSSDLRMAVRILDRIKRQFDHAVIEFSK